MNAVHLTMPVSCLFGAGTCGKYLLRELAGRAKVSWSPPIGSDEALVDDDTAEFAQSRRLNLIEDIDYPLIQLGGPDLEPQSPVRGWPNVGYLFSEWEPLTQKQIENLRKFDVLVAGSEWNARIVRAAGFDCAAVPQGVDREIFRPGPRIAIKDKFVIYSGGKYEHRKAQDLVIRAVKRLQAKHDDIVLMAAWVNLWENRDYYSAARAQGVKLLGMPIQSHAAMAAAMNQTDVALFPNRCEGGTNLVMMEYLACGKPVIANVSTGQRDVLQPDYAMMMKGSDQEMVENMVELVEHFYYNRTSLNEMGYAANAAMGAWSWGRTADGILKAIKNHETVSA